MDLGGVWRTGRGPAGHRELQCLQKIVGGLLSRLVSGPLLVNSLVTPPALNRRHSQHRLSRPDSIL